MLSLNRVEIIGKVAERVVVRYTPSGQEVASFLVDVEREYVAQLGYPDIMTESLRVSAWGLLAKECASHLQEGDTIYVDGRLASHKSTYTELFHDEEFGDHTEEVTDVLMQIVARRIQPLNSNAQADIVVGTRGKLCEAMRYIEDAVLAGSVGAARALQILRSIDLDSID
jgi:single stranded DNA-binding protein